MAEQNLFCLCGRCSRKLRSAAARRVGMGSTCCRKETGRSFNAGPGKAPDEDVVRTDQIGIPGGIATLDADGHLTESQRWEVDGYKKAETDQRISAAVDAHNGAENAHSDIRASVAAMNASIKAIELKFGTNVTKNPFSATFGSLDGLTVTGVWNAEQARVEF